MATRTSREQAISKDHHVQSKILIQRERQNCRISLLNQAVEITNSLQGERSKTRVKSCTVEANVRLQCWKIEGVGKKKMAQRGLLQQHHQVELLFDQRSRQQSGGKRERKTTGMKMIDDWGWRMWLYELEGRRQTVEGGDGGGGGGGEERRNMEWDGVSRESGGVCFVVHSIHPVQYGPFGNKYTTCTVVGVASIARSI